MGDSHHQLDHDTVARYSRQLIMSEIGVKGQVKLKNARVLIVGAGGLGCPAAQYLAAGGVGTIGMVDYDVVETSNLHRQILHTEERAKQSWSKAESAAKALKDLNSRINVIPHILQLDKTNAVDVFKRYDVVVDATDNVTSRYLISDVCVLTDKPLVSGSALRWEGQLTIYHYTDQSGTTGPCYRCLYPVPPPPETVTNCSDGGVIGVVPGIIGCMQALEAMKIIVGVEPSYHQKLYIFDGLNGSSKTVKLRPKQSSCVSCGMEPTIALDDLPDYTEFCGMGANDKCRMLHILDPDDRISVRELKEVLDGSTGHLLVDVRSAVELDICSLPGCMNIPIQELRALESSCLWPTKRTRTLQNIENLKDAIVVKNKNRSNSDSIQPLPIYVMCRLGNDSQKAVEIFRKHFVCGTPVVFKDVRGGIMAWSKQIDPSFPQY